MIVLFVGCSSEASPPRVPSFRRDIAPVLERHCTAMECHGAAPAPDVSLDLRASVSYRDLVGAPAEMGEVRRSRVRPYDVNGSFLIHKLTGPAALREGKRMPLDPRTGEPLEPSPLPPRFVEDVVVRWIDEGAPDN